MKIAVLLPGEPRFCTEFDQFLENLKGVEQVDYFVYLWQNSPPTSNFMGATDNQVVAAAWQNINKEWAENKFKENLPKGHRLVRLELGNQYLIDKEIVTDNYAEETIQPNMWKMYYGIYMANVLRVEHENATGEKYDLVIRTRPDVALAGELDLVNVKEQIDADEKLVITPQNKRCGYNGTWICDLFGIGNSETMTTYCDIYNQITDHHSAGVKFHPETMLGRHLEINGITYRTHPFNIDFRIHGKWIQKETGEEFPAEVNLPVYSDKYYVSSFGRWA